MIGKCVWVIYGNLCFISLMPEVFGIGRFPLPTKRLQTFLYNDTDRTYVEWECRDAFFQQSVLRNSITKSSLTVCWPNKKWRRFSMYPFPTKYVSTRKHAALRSRSIVVRRASKESHLHRRFCWLELPDCNKVVLKGTSKPRLLHSFPPDPKIIMYNWHPTKQKPTTWVSLQYHCTLPLTGPQTRFHAT